LDVKNKERYLNLYLNSKFYLVGSLLSNFFKLGPFYIVPEKPIVYQPHINKFIDVDIIQQHLIRFGIVRGDIRSIIIAKVAFGNFSFILGIINKVQEDSVQIISFGQSVSDLSLSWIEMPSFMVHISKDRIVQKNITFTQKMILKKRWKTFLINYFKL
jgi:hypothetical protein